MAKKIEINEASVRGSTNMTTADGNRLEKLLLVIAGQMGLILTAMGKAMPPGEDQERMKQAAIDMTKELAQIYNFEFYIQ